MPKADSPVQAENVDEASRNAFDRETGLQLDPRDLKTYREALRFYHLSPESKFLGGDYIDYGRTERRHILDQRHYLHRQRANRWEEQLFVGFDETSEIDYGGEPGGISLDERLRRSCAEFGQRKTAELLGVSRSTVLKAQKRGCQTLKLKTRAQIQKRSV